MSGDVQPRKRKDKKRKKDELGVEEPRGTAAVLGEGDVFMHSQHEHGTGGHWCAKVIFFSLLAVLITLIGLIILENRGLTDLDANSVESRYSGVLEGWLEDAPDDDHHDEHTLELLKQHEEDDHDQIQEVSEEDEHDNANDDKSDLIDHDDEDESGHDDEDENSQDDADDENDNEASIEDEEQDDDDDDGDDDQDQQEDDNSEEQPLEEVNEDEDDDDELAYGNDDSSEDNDDEDDDLQKVDENDTDDDEDDLQNDQAYDRSIENDDDDFQNDQVVDQNVKDFDDDKDDFNSQEDEENYDEEHEEHEEEEEEDSGIEVEKLEKEVSDEEALSEEQPTQEEDDDKSLEISTELPFEDDGDAGDDVEDEEFLEAEVDDTLPIVERIVAPKGKPLAEVEDEPTTSKPADTLADEEEYEKQQEELRKEQAQASHVWLKLAVGGALLVATHAVVSRVVAPRDDTPASEGHDSREETPSTIDRRMTLIPEETTAAATPKEVIEKIAKPIIKEKVFEKISPIIQSISTPHAEDSEEEEVDEDVIVDTKDVTSVESTFDLETEDKELYSDEDEIDEDDIEEIVKEKKEAPVQVLSVPKKVDKPEHEEQEEAEDVPDDVEIIDDEQLEEELEEEEDDEEEISDVDDAELLTRLEAKYGRLPEPERPGQKYKDGGNSIEADWPGEPSDKYWRQQLDEAEQELHQGDWSAASERVTADQLKSSARARWILARAIDASAEAKRDNRLLTRAITAYLDVLKLNERMSDVRLREIADRTLDRIRFRGNYLSAEPVYRLLIRRFPDVVDHRNNLTVSFLMANRADLAEEVIRETLKKWPNDRIALAHLGFILKTQHNRLEEAVEAFQKALEGDTGPATEPRFYYHLGDSLLLLGRFAEAHEVHKRGAKQGHFLSPAQRSLYNVERLKSRPWWDVEQTPYLKLARALEKSWKEILKEGLAAQALYEKEKEGLKERGEWSQLDLFVRGQEVPGRCNRAPVTCSIVRAEAAAAGCRRGQVKFSAMEAGTHVRPHVGPTNCRLRMHLGLSNTKDTYIRVDQETRQWQVGKVLMFDDSFEHEVWHNGTGARLVLIVDVWHPALTPAERRSLPPI